MVIAKQQLQQLILLKIFEQYFARKRLEEVLSTTNKSEEQVLNHSDAQVLNNYTNDQQIAQSLWAVINNANTMPLTIVNIIALTSDLVDHYITAERGTLQTEALQNIYSALEITPKPSQQTHISNYTDLYAPMNNKTLNLAQEALIAKCMKIIPNYSPSIQKIETQESMPNPIISNIQQTHEQIQQKAAKQINTDQLNLADTQLMLDIATQLAQNYRRINIMLYLCALMLLVATYVFFAYAFPIVWGIVAVTALIPNCWACYHYTQQTLETNHGINKLKERLGTLQSQITQHDTLINIQKQKQISAQLIARMQESSHHNIHEHDSSETLKLAPAGKPNAEILKQNQQPEVLQNLNTSDQNIERSLKHYKILERTIPLEIIPITSEMPKIEIYTQQNDLQQNKGINKMQDQSQSVISSKIVQNVKPQMKEKQNMIQVDISDLENSMQNQDLYNISFQQEEPQQKPNKIVSQSKRDNKQQYSSYNQAENQLTSNKTQSVKLDQKTTEKKSNNNNDLDDLENLQFTYYGYDSESDQELLDLFEEQTTTNNIQSQNISKQQQSFASKIKKPYTSPLKQNK